MLCVRILHLIRTLLEHRYIPAVLAVVTVVIMLPALKAGFIQDDLFHRAKLLGPSELPERFYDMRLSPPDSGTLRGVLRDMYAIVPTERDYNVFKDYGLLPWWTAEDFRGTNWRPLTAFTHWLDYQLFPNSPALMHAHSLIWFAAVIFLVSILYRKLLGPVWIAGLAALLYMVDDSNYFPAMWIANRNLILSLFFSILTLLMYHRWRQQKSLCAAIAVPFFLLLSLLSTEAGIATFAYLFAYALIIDRGSLRRRALSLAPSFIVIVIWRIIYNALDYGARGSGFIIDPGSEPLRYAWAVVKRAPVLLSGQWGCLPAEMFNLFSDYAKRWNLLAAAAFLLLVLIVFLPLLRKNRVALFWFTGMMLCILPICATSPMNRNLLFAAIGAFGLTAQFIGGLFIKESWVPRSQLWRVPAWILCLTLILIHLLLAMAGRITAPRTWSFAFDTFYSTVDVGSQPDIENKTVVVVNAPHPFLFLGLPVLRAHENKPFPQRTRILAPGFVPLEITRTGEKTLLVKAQAGNILSTETSREDFRPNFVYIYDESRNLFRPEDLQFRAGERVELIRMSVEVIDVDRAGQPVEVQFRFAVSLDDPSLSWLQWDWKKSGFGSYSQFEVPAVGERAYIEGPF
ncbi:MAG: hypothetical protein ACETWQ_16585 [Phycisphaerae bacterium]